LDDHQPIALPHTIILVESPTMVSNKKKANHKIAPKTIQIIVLVSVTPIVVDGGILSRVVVIFSVQTNKDLYCVHHNVSARALSRLVRSLAEGVR
jgi:hypothetical protein